MNIVTEQRIDARKSIARCENMIRQLKSTDRHAILRVIAVERAFIKYNFNGFSADDVQGILNKIAEIRHARIADILRMTNTIHKFAELMPTVPGAPDEYVRPDSVPTFNKLLAILEQNVNQETNEITADQHPSPNDMRRWALKSAVLDYYKGMNMTPEQAAELKVTNSAGSNRTIPQLAPSKRPIYDIWLQKLDALTRAGDKFKFNPDEYQEAIDKGTPQGGAFEKMLDRYREQFMSQLWQQHQTENANLG